MIDPDLVRALTSHEPLRRDLTITPKPDERKPCPHCHEPADEILYEGAMVHDVTTSSPRNKPLGVSIRVSSVTAATFRPCGHRFDGATGELLPEGFEPIMLVDTGRDLAAPSMGLVPPLGRIQFPAGQTAGERAVRMIRDAGFELPEDRRDD